MILSGDVLARSSELGSSFEVTSVGLGDCDRLGCFTNCDSDVDALRLYADMSKLLYHDLPAIFWR